METGWRGSQSGSFAEIGNLLILYAKNFLSKWAHKAECTYVIPTWHVTQKEFQKELFCYNDFASDSRMSSPLAGLPWFDGIISFHFT